MALLVSRVCAILFSFSLSVLEVLCKYYAAKLCVVNSDHSDACSNNLSAANSRRSFAAQCERQTVISNTFYHITSLFSQCNITIIVNFILIT